MPCGMIGIGIDRAIHAATDITGFGLLGHLFQLARASRVGLELDSNALPALPDVETLIAAKNITRGDRTNREYLGEHLVVDANVAEWRLSLMLDPQTSGGLAICVRPDALDALLEALAAQNVETRAIIGRVTPSQAPVVRVY